MQQAEEMTEAQRAFNLQELEDGWNAGSDDMACSKCGAKIDYVENSNNNGWCNSCTFADN